VISAASLALADARLEMRDLVAACSLVCICNSALLSHAAERASTLDRKDGNLPLMRRRVEWMTLFSWTRRQRRRTGSRRARCWHTCRWQIWCVPSLRMYAEIRAVPLIAGALPRAAAPLLYATTLLPH